MSKWKSAIFCKLSCFRGKSSAKVIALGQGWVRALAENDATGVCEQRHSFWFKPLPRNPALEAALHPPIWRSDSLSSEVSASPDFFFNRHRYLVALSEGDVDLHDSWESLPTSSALARVVCVVGFVNNNIQLTQTRKQLPRSREHM